MKLSAGAAGLLLIASLLPLSVGLHGCSRPSDAETSKGKNGKGGEAANGPVAVDVVAARIGALRPELEYTGTTRPTREVSLRAQAEGRLLTLAVDVGDRVQRGQVVARLDDDLLQSAVQQAEAELASRISQVASARSQVGDARTRVQQARFDLTQKQADAGRYAYLAKEGAGAVQTAEQTRTAARIAAQAVRSAEQQVKNLQSVVEAAQGQVKSQQAAMKQAKERLSYAVLRAPVTGLVTAKVSDVGNLVQPGGEVLRIGDFRLAQVDVQVSELELSRVSVGQLVRVALDAFNGREIIGRVDRISPQADTVSRLVPVTVTVANTNGKIGGGLLARVRFGRTADQKIVIPDSAFQVAQKPGQDGAPDSGGPSGGSGGAASGASGQSAPSGQSGQGSGTGAGGAPQQGKAGASSTQGAAVTAQNNRATTAQAASAERPDAQQTEMVYVLVGEGQLIPEKKEDAKGGDEKQDKGAAKDKGGEQAQQEKRPPPRAYAVEPRQVRIAARADGQAEVLQGLQPGDRVVTRSSRPLKQGDTVRPSVLSEEQIAQAEEIRQRAQQQAESSQQNQNLPTDLPRGRGAQSAGQAGQSSSSQGAQGGSQGTGSGRAASGAGGSGSGSGGGLTGIGGPSAGSAAGGTGSGSSGSGGGN
ncbi:MAG: efflux RND transporter periplasmic adaptor subunit [Armatimonadota bacterium]